MRSHKLILLIALWSLLIACSATRRGALPVNLNAPMADSLFNRFGDNIAIVSCLRCACFVDALNKEFVEKSVVPTGYILITDTSCNKFRFNVQHVPAATLDRLSDDIYNVTFLQKRDTGIAYRILHIEESARIHSIAQRFFAK